MKNDFVNGKIEVICPECKYKHNVIINLKLHSIYKYETIKDIECNCGLKIIFNLDLEG